MSYRTLLSAGRRWASWPLKRRTRSAGGSRWRRAAYALLRRAKTASHLLLNLRIGKRLRDLAVVAKPRRKENLVGVQAHLVNRPPEGGGELVKAELRLLGLRINAALEEPNVAEERPRKPRKLAEVYVAAYEINSRVRRGAGGIWRAEKFKAEPNANCHDGDDDNQ